MVEKVLDDFEMREGWRPEHHSREQIEEFTRYIDSITEITRTERNTYLDIREGIKISERRKKEIRRWMVNEKFLCFADARYFIDRYAWICNESNDIFKVQLRQGQEIFLQCIEEFDDAQTAIEVFVMKSRQVGISTLIVLLFIHRLLFVPHTQGVMASVDAGKSELLSRMMDTCWDRLPFWLTPEKTVTKAKKPEWSNGSVMSIQSGKQAVGIAQGWTPTLIHISEVADIPYPEKTLEEGLFRAAHSTGKLFFALEGTGSDPTTWQSKKWKYYLENWGKGGRFLPVFIPWGCAPDLYPERDWLRKHPIPDAWVPMEETKRMKHRAELYIRSAPALSRVMGTNWQMSREQMWFWDCNWREALASNTTKVWLAQMACVGGGTLISTEQGIIPIQVAESARECESGRIANWIPKGVKPIFELRTKYGRVLRGTAEHLVRTATGWKELATLEHGECVDLMPPRFAESLYAQKWNDTPIYECSRVIDETMGRFLGYFMGDGSFNANQVTIACDSKDIDTIADVMQVITKITGRNPNYYRVGNMVRVRSSYIHWMPLLRALGAIKSRADKDGHANGYTRQVCVPTAIFRSPQSVVREFLRGLYECDGHGCKATARVQFCSSHDSFLRSVQVLLLGFGINSKFMKMQVVAGGTVRGGKRHSYTKRNLDIPAGFANTFYDDIGFVGQRKQSHGKRYNGKVRVNSEFVDFVEEVIDTEQCEQVYDITVDVTHSFSANGISVHNCTPNEAMQGKHDLVFSEDVIEVASERRQKTYDAYAITGHSVRFGQNDEEYTPDPDIVDYDKPRIPVAWKGKDGHIHNWELVPLKAFDDAADESAFNKLLIFHHPEPGRNYSLGIDTADGLGMPDEDRTVISGAENRHGNARDDQVCEFVSLTLNPAQCVSIAGCIAAYYGQWEGGRAGTKDPRGVKFCIEQRDRPGDDCQFQLKLMGFTWHHVFSRIDQKHSNDKNRGNQLGWLTNFWSRPWLLNKFVDAVTGGWYKPNSPMLIRQMSKWVRKVDGQGRSRMDHQSGGHDDCIFAGALAYMTVHSHESMTSRQGAKYANPDDIPPLSTEWCSGMSVTV